MARDVSMEQSLQMVEVGGVRMETEAILHSGNHEIEIETSDLHWETTLELENRKKFITSEEFVLNFETANETRWRIELDPNYIDQNGKRYVSVYLILTKTILENTIITASFEVKLLTSETTYYKKSAGLSKFSKEKPSYGFAKYISFSQLGPFASPNITEKLKFVVTLNMMRDVIESESNVETETTSESSFFIDSTPPSPLKYNAYLAFNGDSIHVDSHRLSYYTPFFKKYLIYDRKEIGAKQELDLTVEFHSLPLLKKILEFCHQGKTAIPKRTTGLMMFLKTSVKLDITKLKVQCQDEILKRLDVKSFTDVVDLAREGCLDAKKAFPVIYDFMIQNIKNLRNDAAYNENYEKNKMFYEELMLNCEDIDTNGNDLNPLIAFYVRNEE